MWLLVGTVAITLLSIYFLIHLSEDHPLYEPFIFVLFFGVVIIPSLIIFIVLEHYDVVQEYKIFPLTLPLFLMAGIVLWATRGKTINGSDDTDDKKDDFTSAAIIMTAVLSDDEKSENSNNSSSSGSSSSRSDDDFFIL